MNDEIKWVGDFYKLINNNTHKDLLKLMNRVNQDAAKKKDDERLKLWYELIMWNRQYYIIINNNITQDITWIQLWNNIIK